MTRPPHEPYTTLWTIAFCAGIPLAELRLPSKNRHHNRTRVAAMLFLRDHGWPLSAIARYFNVDPSAVSYATAPEGRRATRYKGT